MKLLNFSRTIKASHTLRLLIRDAAPNLLNDLAKELKLQNIKKL